MWTFEATCDHISPTEVAKSQPLTHKVEPLYGRGGRLFEAHWSPISPPPESDQTITMVPSCERYRIPWKLRPAFEPDFGSFTQMRVKSEVLIIFR